MAVAIRIVFGLSPNILGEGGGRMACHQQSNLALESVAAFL